jgi:hypothetical protein
LTTGEPTGLPRIKICRRGCSPERGGNIGTLEATTVPPSFVCPAPTECRQVRTQTVTLGGSTTVVPIYACTPCGLRDEPTCTSPYREGCTTVLSADLGGGIVRLGNLIAQDGVCRPRSCGFSGGACCPPDVSTLPVGPSVFPQGDRCQAPNQVCSSETGAGTCVSCGNESGRCCEARLSDVLRRSASSAQPTSSNSVCAAPRNDQMLRAVPTRCPGQAGPTTARCASPVGASVTQVCQNGIDPYTPGAAQCVPCGGPEQPCCEGSVCNDARNNCVPGGAGGVNGTCTPCGQPGQPCCNCPSTTAPANGCVVAAPSDAQIVCSGTSRICVQVAE